MTPAEKAEELYTLYQDTLPDAVEVSSDTIKACALICVKDHLSDLKDYNNNIDFYGFTDMINYWNNVRKEIEKL